MASSVIREFLVALGFKTDESALAKFSLGIEKATKSVLLLATAVEATASTVAVGIARFASNLEALYFASQRTGASASNLKAFALAAQNFGASADEALGSVEALASFLRNNPGGEGILQGLGLQTRDPKTGRMRDTTDLLLDFGKATAKMPFYLANQYAQILGVSERTLLALRNGEFEAELDKRRTQLENVGFKQATEDAHRFMEQLRDLLPFVEQFGVRVYEAIANRLGFTIEKLTVWLQQNGPWLADRIVEAAVKVIGWAETLIVWIEVVIAKLKEWDKETDGWSTKLLGALILLKAIGGAEIIGGVLSLAAAFVKLGTSIGTAGAAGVAAKGVGLLGMLGWGVGGGIAAGWALDKLFPDNWLARFGNYIGGGLYESIHRSEAAVRQFEDMGWTHAQAAGIVANLSAESALNPTAVGDGGNAVGIAQWHADRFAGLQRWAASNNLDPSALDTQLKYVNVEARSDPQLMAMMRAAGNAGTAGEIFSRYYERPADADAEAIRRGNAAVTLSQKTDIHVYGTGNDPISAANAVAAEQSRVNQEMVHNLAPRVQ